MSTRTRAARTPVRWARPEADAGFSMVEVMMALLLLSVGSLSMSTVFLVGLRTASVSSIRSEAVALATRETEALRAIPYAEIGFYDSQFPSSAFGSPVSLGATPESGVTPRILPTGSTVVGVKAFEIARHIVKVNAVGPASATYVSAYKRTIVVVSWSDGGGDHAVKQESAVYPGGQGVFVPGRPTPVASAAPTPPNAPVLAAVAPPADPAGRTQLDLAWTPSPGPVSYYVVQYSTIAAFVSPVSSPQQPPSATAYQASGLAPATTHYFRVVAYGAGGTTSPPSNVQSGTTLPQPDPTPCTVTSLAVSGTGTDLNQGRATKTYLRSGNRRLLEPLSLSVSYSGVCTGSFSINSVFTTTGTPDGMSPYTLAGSGGTLTGTIPRSNESWSAGSHTFTVLQSGVAVSPAVQQTFLFCAGTTDPRPVANAC